MEKRTGLFFLETVDFYFESVFYCHIGRLNLRVVAILSNGPGPNFAHELILIKIINLKPTPGNKFVVIRVRFDSCLAAFGEKFLVVLKKYLT